MGYIRDLGTPREEIAEQLEERADVSQLTCPKCGSNAVVVLEYPRGAPPRIVGEQWEGSWFGGTSGRARCDSCGVTFPIQQEADES